MPTIVLLQISTKSLGNFLTIDGCFNSVTPCVTVLAEEERKNKTNNSEFGRFQVGHLRKFQDTLSTTVYWGSIYNLFTVLLDATR